MPSTFVSSVSTGAWYDARTSGCAARWNTSSGRASRTTAARFAASRTSASTLVQAASTAAAT